MIRTQVHLPAALFQRIQLTAQKENKPVAEVVRELLTESLERKTRNIGKALLDLAKNGGKGPTDLSANIDNYLYKK